MLRSCFLIALLAFVSICQSQTIRLAGSGFLATIGLCLLLSCSHNPASNNQEVYSHSRTCFEAEYLDGAFFFLDSLYLRESNKRAAHAPDTLPGLPRIVALQVWLQADSADLVNPPPSTIFRNVSAFDSTSTSFNPGGNGMTFKQLVQDVHTMLTPGGDISASIAQMCVPTISTSQSSCAPITPVSCLTRVIQLLLAQSPMPTDRS